MKFKFSLRHFAIVPSLLAHLLKLLFFKKKFNVMQIYHTLSLHSFLMCTCYNFPLFSLKFSLPFSHVGICVESRLPSRRAAYRRSRVPPPTPATELHQGESLSYFSHSLYPRVWKRKQTSQEVFKRLWKPPWRLDGRRLLHIPQTSWAVLSEIISAKSLFYIQGASTRN